MDECQIKGLCYNCDEKCFPWHKCKDKKLFMAMTEDISEEEVIVSPIHELPPPFDMNPPYDPLEVGPVISLNSLTGFSTP
jgi:hypothetical protein